MSIKSLCGAILDVVQEFDSCVAPFGLYSVRDILLQPRPKDVLSDFTTLVERRPELVTVRSFAQQMSAVSQWAKEARPLFHWDSHEFGAVELSVVRVSKIKVRQFGSKYQVDKNESFPARWDELKLNEQIKQLWAHSSYPQEGLGLRLLLFIGFDKAQRPFEREFAQLKPELSLPSHGVTFTSHQWKDPHNRHFAVRAAIWACPKAG